MKLDLLNKKCGPCEKQVKPFDKDTAFKYLGEVSSWQISNDYLKIYREFVFKDFAYAMAFVNKVSRIAEEEGHHPDIHISYNRVLLELWTHNIKGLSENDFIVAAKVNEIKSK